MAEDTPNPLTELRRNLTRDKQIILCYRAGNTVPTIADAFGLSKQRVQQILQKNGVTKQDNPKTRNKELYAFIGANVTLEVKKLVEEEVKRKHTSISAWVKRLIETELSVNLGEQP